MGSLDLEALLLQSGAYRDLEEPLVVTSGEFLTPFYVNAERLCGDPDVDGALGRFADDDGSMIDYARDLADREAGFAAVIDLLCREAEGLLPPEGGRAISGGQRRDWLFSGPVAARLGVPHISLFKQSPGSAASSDRLVLREPGGGTDEDPSLGGVRVVHIVDMVTKASSCWSVDPSAGREVGWIPLLRSRGARVEDLVAVVSRAQGGEQRLADRGVAVHSLCVVDAGFVARHSRDPEAAAGYVEDPVGWTERYLRQSGIGVILPLLEDTPKKLPRAIRFLRAYRGCLEEAGVWPEAEREVRRRLGRSLEDLLA